MTVGEAEAFALELDVIVQTVLPPESDVASLARLAESILRAEGAAGVWSVAVVLTDDDSLRELHRRFMEIDSYTDVMTFPSSGAEGLSSHGGDIVISVDRAVEQAVEFGHSPWDETRFLVTHGLLHLCGWDDSTEESRKKMLKRQADLLAEYDQGPSVRAQ